MWRAAFLCLIAAVHASWLRNASQSPGGAAPSATPTLSWETYDAYFTAHYQGDWPISTYTVDIIHSNQPRFQTTSSWPAEGIPERLVCDFVWFTAHDVKDAIYPLEDGIRSAYAKFQEGMCLLNVNGRIGNATTLVAWLERYRAGLIVQELIFRGKIRTPSGGYPALLYTDGDAFPMNKRLSIQDLQNRFARGVTLGKTAEAEACQTNADVKCPPGNHFPPSSDHIAFSVALEAYCASYWATNSGVWYMQPSRLVQTILASVILAVNAQVDHPFDKGDQGYMNYVLQELFGVGMSHLTSVCGKDEYFPDYWKKSLDPEVSQMMFTRKLQLKQALTHPVISTAARLFLGDEGELLSPDDPQYVAWVAPRWMNAPGCPWYMGDPTRAELAYHPGDFIVHFNSCNHHGYSGEFFRKWVAEHGADVTPVNDDDRDWAQWARLAAKFRWAHLPIDKVVHTEDVKANQAKSTPKA